MGGPVGNDKHVRFGKPPGNREQGRVTREQTERDMDAQETYPLTAVRRGEKQD